MTATLVLDARLDTAAARALARALIDRRGADLEIDGGLVALIGALSAQTLLAARATWNAAGRNFAIRNASGEMWAQLAALGCAGILDKPEGGHR